MDSTNSLLLTRFQALFRELLWHNPSWFDSLYITEFPKSGGTWLCQLISGYFGRHFYRNQMPGISGVYHGHKAYSRQRDQANVTLLVRDGRDVVVSFYHHALFYSDKNFHQRVSANRKRFGFDDVEDIERNLPIFIEDIFTRPLGIINYGNWNDFNIRWIENSRSVPILSYEELREDTPKALGKLVLQLNPNQPLNEQRLTQVIDEFSFERQKSKSKPQEHSFVRKGIVGDWKNSFSEEAREVFAHYGNEALLLLGYENSPNWYEHY